MNVRRSWACPKEGVAPIENPVVRLATWGSAWWTARTRAADAALVGSSRFIPDTRKSNGSPSPTKRRDALFPLRERRRGPAGWVLA